MGFLAVIRGSKITSAISRVCNTTAHHFAFIIFVKCRRSSVATCRIVLVFPNFKVFCFRSCSRTTN